MIWIVIGVVVVLGLVAMVIYDQLQTKHTILKNFSIIGHFRYWLEALGPELRQYIVTNNDEERPFSCDQRRWVYARRDHCSAPADRSSSTGCRRGIVSLFKEPHRC